MSEIAQAYPLQWPVGWKRTLMGDRVPAQFNKKERQYSADRASSWDRAKSISIADGRARVLAELRRLGIDGGDLVISTNMRTRQDGQLHAGAGEPLDSGVAVYWRKGKASRCMAIDRYDRVADNLAAIAATIEAMRAIERHGGASILDRAFTGFTALPAPEQWFQVLGVSASATRAEITAAHRRLASEHHPDKGGEEHRMIRINLARDEGLAQATA